jgi:trimeric autotransporter adhesin
VKNQLLVNAGTGTAPAWQNVTAAKSWQLTGNSGTNPVSNFIGTTGNQPLLFRLNNQWAGSIDSVTNNTYAGFGAGKNGKGGSANTAAGYQSLYANTTGYNNTSLGYQALCSNVTGTNNTASGCNALDSNKAYSNTGSGYAALNKNTSGFINTAIGYYALANNINGYSNTAIGSSALQANTSGAGNTADGYQTISSGTLFNYYNTGDYNTATGSGSMVNNTTGQYNTATGNNALGSNQTGQFNTSNGSDALGFNLTGSYNTVFGSRTLSNTYNISQNTAIGFNALLSTGNADGNTAIGFDAGYNYAQGYYNCFIGASNDANGSGYYNTISIGHGAVVTAPNMMRVGNGATTSIGGPVGWSTISDKRIKKNVQENIPGLNFINRLRPVTYNISLTEIDNILQPATGKNTDRRIVEKNIPPQMQQAFRDKEQIIYSGFIAQEVEEAAKSIGFIFSGIDAPKNNNDLYGLRYDAFVVPLVKSVQELTEQNKDIKKEMGKIQTDYTEMSRRLDALKKKIGL